MQLPIAASTSSADEHDDGRHDGGDADGQEQTHGADHVMSR